MRLPILPRLAVAMWLLLGLAACKKNEPAPPARVTTEGIYEAIPRGPFRIDPALRQPTPTPRHAKAKAPTIVMAVLDTVRADHTSICGYPRDTTPYLKSLVAKGAAHVCRAYSPGDWSLPSHASYFTGVSVARHGAHYAHGLDGEDDDGERVRSLYVYPLRDEIPTLAEEMSARGYQTVLVTDNGLLSEAGLQRGFDIVAARPRKHDPRVDWVPPTLARVLSQDVDPDKPLFLVLNYIQAHDPWITPDPNLGWDLLEPQMRPNEFATGFKLFLRGKLAPHELGFMRRQLIDLYDFGVYREDRALRASLASLENAGWLAPGYRIAITADHGELLMEHGLWRHLFIYEGNTRVPFVYWTDGDTPVLPEPFPAIAIHGLLRDGKLPSPLPIAESVAIPNPDMKKGRGVVGQPAAAMWIGDDKLMWIGGEFVKVKPLRDPSERSHAPLGDHPQRAQLEALVAAIEVGRDRNAVVDKAVVEQLRALGYVE
ncbi:MAG: sulfatase-like hydrolase/transferase [Polyangiales bacterium]